MSSLRRGCSGKAGTNQKSHSAISVSLGQLLGCESAALNMPANMENSAVAAGEAQIRIKFGNRGEHPENQSNQAGPSVGIQIDSGQGTEQARI